MHPVWPPGSENGNVTVQIEGHFTAETLRTPRKPKEPLR